MITCKIRTDKNKIYITPNIDGNLLPEYDYVDSKEKLQIYELIKNEKYLNLIDKFLVDFSMKEYREIYKIDKDQIIDIYIDSIFNCFFYGFNEHDVDFSNCKFHSIDIEMGLLMDENWFYNTNLDFSYSFFSDLDLSLARCNFFNCHTKFIYSSFGNQDINFNESSFYGLDNDIIFYGTTLGNSGDIVFDNIKGLYGSIEFNRIYYSNKRISFVAMDCSDGDVYFIESEFPLLSVEFTDSFLRAILFFQTNLNGLLKLNIAKAEHIIIQDCVIRDFVLLGNKGYKNYTSYCFKDSTILGRVRIQNRFSKKLFNKQKKYAFDPRIDQFGFYNTTYHEKANQLKLLSENFRNDGDEELTDGAYYLSKRFRSLGKIQDCLYDYPAVLRTEEYKDSLFKIIIAFLGITLKLLLNFISYIFEKLFLDVFCGRYATKPARFLFWIVFLILGFAFIFHLLSTSIGFNTAFEINGTIYQNMNVNIFHILFSFFVFFQIGFDNIIILNQNLLIIALLERIIGLTVLALFVVSFTRKVIK